MEESFLRLVWLVLVRPRVSSGSSVNKRTYNVAIWEPSRMIWQHKIVATSNSFCDKRLLIFYIIHWIYLSIYHAKHVCSILYNKVEFSGWIYTSSIRFHCSQGANTHFRELWLLLQMPRCGHLIYVETNWNCVSAKFCFQKRMNIKKYAIQRPYKYMWVVQLGRPHIFMQPLGRIFLYNIFF